MDKIIIAVPSFDGYLAPSDKLKELVKRVQLHANIYGQSYTVIDQCGNKVTLDVLGKRDRKQPERGCF